MTVTTKVISITKDKVGNIECECHATDNGNYYLTMPNEKKSSKKPNIADMNKIRNKSIQRTIRCAQYIKTQLHTTKVSKCSFQLILALVADYLGKTKQYSYMVDCSYRTTKLTYSKEVYNIAHAVIILALEFEGI
jgi:hypothetical protein